MPRKPYRKRLFLNDGEGVAFIQAVAEQNHDWQDKSKKRIVSFNGTVTISDCSRQITLDFDFYRKKYAARRLRKIRKLIDTLEAVEAEMLAAVKVMQPPIPRKKEGVRPLDLE